MMRLRKGSRHKIKLYNSVNGPRVYTGYGPGGRRGWKRDRLARKKGKAKLRAQISRLRARLRAEGKL